MIDYEEKIVLSICLNLGNKWPDFESPDWTSRTGRRKFRSQTSDNMDRWKSRGGMSERGEEKQWEDQKGERVRRKKRQVKVGKSRFTVFFWWFVALEGRKVGSLKRRVRSHRARWEMNNCTPVWRETHFQVKMYKHTMFGPLLKIAMSKKCTALWREAHFQVKSVKKIRVRTTFWHSDVEKLWRKAHFQVKSAKKIRVRTTFDVRMSKKCTRLWREAHVQVNRVKNWQARTTFWRSDV